MGKLRVYCLKTLNKLSIYPLGNTPSAPSEWRGARVTKDEGTKAKVTQGRIRALEPKGVRDKVSGGGESEE